MSQTPPPQARPPQPPPSPPQFTTNNHLHKPKSSLPELFFSALSLLFLFSPSSKPTTTTTNSSLSLLQNPRRFLRNLIMSQPTTTAKNNPFTTPQSLSEWLKPRMPSDSFASWGVNPGTKNVHNLWLELAEGETSLADSTPPIRTVTVVTVRIINAQNKILIESHQELSDGTVRSRCRPLSEKMKPGETVDIAAVRAVKEELGSILDVGFDHGDCGGIVRIVDGSYRRKVEERVSASYPGLPAFYVLHTVDAVVEGLPEGEFCTEEHEEYKDCDETRIANKAVSVKRHYWKWVDADSV